MIIWPDDHFQRLVNVKPDQTITLKFSDAKEKWIYDTVTTKKPIFKQTPLTDARHNENAFNDYTIQVLLPNYLSRQGPCIEVEDLNSDGLPDFFMGGAKNGLSRIFIQNTNGEFRIIQQTGMVKDPVSEEVAATFFDADNDGDKDLYVASGGYEFSEHDAALNDRLYLNNGKGSFIKKEDALPQMLTSKGCVKAADLDGDGDIDLFVGGRVVPGQYPTAPRSYLLLNDGKGLFTDATENVCAALLQPGMVTDAAWTDLNNDKQPDLVIVGEWMPIKVFINQKGKLGDESSTYIHFASSGWWNRIVATDMDGDGDIDLIAGNCGLNTQFQVNEKEPMTMYYKDFDNNGSIDPVLCYYINGVSYPAASRDDLTDQLPGLKKKFLQYKDYANATINDLFTADQLKGTELLKAETMQTVYLENKAGREFLPHSLPSEAQYAPVYAIAAADMNQDGKKDILLAGNNTWTRIKFGFYKANHGILLTGDGKGDFKYVPQWQSGLNIRGNVRSMQFISTGKKTKLIVGINDSPVQMITTIE